MESINLLHGKKILHFNIHCPIKTKYIAPIDCIKPWINQCIKFEMKKRQPYMQLLAHSKYRTMSSITKDVQKVYYNLRTKGRFVQEMHYNQEVLI